MVITDSNLRKISISTSALLIEEPTAGEYTLNHDLLEFIRAISSKYRIYLLTKLSNEREELDKIKHIQIQELLNKLVK